jgi:fatty acid-binding protein DegV
MNKVAVMTDTIASIRKEIAKEYGIEGIPFHVIMDGKSYIKTKIDMNELYARLNQRENLPTTSAPFHKKVHVAIAHANVPEQAEQLRDMILSSFLCDELYISEVAAMPAVHNGEGLIEFGFYAY